MKRNFLTLLGVLVISATYAQSSTKVTGTQKAAATMDRKAKMTIVTEPGKKEQVSAGAGESLTSPDGKNEQKAKPMSHSKKNSIPDGRYGTNRSGQVYSPSNPNFPYDRDGKIHPSLRGSVNSKRTRGAETDAPKVTTSKSTML